MKREHDAVEKARRPSDNGVLAICLSVIFAILLAILGFVYLLQLGAEYAQDELGPYFYAEEQPATFGDTFFTWVFIALALLVFILVTIRVIRQMNLGNALQVEYSDYAWLRDWSNKVAEDLNMPQVEIFVTQDPFINAYALGFMKPYNIVLNSGSIRYMSKEELKVIVVHEMAHVKYKHTNVSAYLAVLRSVPIIGAVFSWVLDFWSRRTELTSDRLSLAYIGDVELVKSALIKIHVGPDVAESFNDVARQWQAYNTTSSFNRFSQTFFSHPFLVRRLAHVDTYAHLVDKASEGQDAAAA